MNKVDGSIKTSKQDFIESKIKKLDKILTKNSWEGHFDSTIELDPACIKNFLTFSLNEAWEKGYKDGVKEGLKCVPEANKLLSGIKNKARQKQREELIKWCEENKINCRNRSTIFDTKDYIDFKKISAHLKSL